MLRATALLLTALLAGPACASLDDGPPLIPLPTEPPLGSFSEFKQDILSKQPRVEVVVEDDVVPPPAPGASEQQSQAGLVSNRVNYASQSVGASVVAHNPEAKGAKALLTGDPDGYYMSPCSAKKWIIIGMAEEVCAAGQGGAGLP